MYLRNFSWIRVQVCKLQQFFKGCEKTMKKKAQKFAHSYLGNALRNFHQISCIVSLRRRVPLQQLWCSSDKISWSYECVIIASLLFLLIYLRSLRAPCFFGSHDTLPCVLIYSLPFVRVLGFLSHTTHYCVS